MLDRVYRDLILNGTSFYRFLIIEGKVWWNLKIFLCLMSKWIKWKCGLERK